MSFITPGLKGLDVLDEIIRMVKRYNPVLLNNIGITIDLRKLDSWKEYDAAHTMLFGSGLFGRLWATRIRKFFAPIAQLDAEHQYRKASFVLQAELLDKVIEEGTRCVEEIDD